MQAMEKVNMNIPELKLIVAGGGKYYFDIEKYLSHPYISIQNRFIPDDELASLIQQSEFVVIPYVEATQSGVIMSSYAFDKPCVATKVGGLPEMVIDGYNGTVVEARNSIALANAIETLFNNKGTLKTYTYNIHKDYQDGRKSWKYVSEELKTIYNTIG